MTTRPRIILTRGLPEAAVARASTVGHVWMSPVDRPLMPSELLDAVKGADAVVSLLHDRINVDVLNAAGEQLRIVANVAAGYDNIDVAACVARNVVVTNTPGVLTEATADIALALILMVTRRLAEAERLIRARRTWSWQMDFHLGRSVQSKVLGIVGLGEIGRAAARRGRAIGMSIVYSGPRRAPRIVETELDAAYVGFGELLERADVVSLHCPLNDDTHHLIDAAALMRMKPDAVLINTSRGPVLDEAALADALAGGVIAGAGLDVYEAEPEVDPRLLELDNVVLLPHLGSATIETRTAMATLAVENVVRVVEGSQPLTPVNQPTNRSWQ